MIEGKHCECHDNQDRQDYFHVCFHVWVLLFILFSHSRFPVLYYDVLNRKMCADVVYGCKGLRFNALADFSDVVKHKLCTLMKHLLQSMPVCGAAFQQR